MPKVINILLMHLFNINIPKLQRKNNIDKTKLYFDALFGTRFILFCMRGWTSILPKIWCFICDKSTCKMLMTNFFQYYSEKFKKIHHIYIYI